MKLSYSAFLASSAWVHKDKAAIELFQAMLDSHYGKITIKTSPTTEEQISRCEVKLLSSHINGNLNRVIYIWREPGNYISPSPTENFSCYFLSNNAYDSLCRSSNGFLAVMNVFENHESERYVRIKNLFDFDFNADLARIASATKTPIADMIPKSKLK